MNHLQHAFSTFIWLIWRDIRVLGKNFVSSLIDAALLPIGWTFTSGYVMPLLGVPDNYGAFMLAGLAAGMCFNSTGTDGGNLVSDLEGPKSISYELSLPITYWMICIKTAIVYALRSMALNIFIFPIGALMLWGKIDIAAISYGKFLLIYLVANLMYGFFSLLVALSVKDNANYGRFWIRWGWLLFTSGGFQFSWHIMKEAVPIFGYISLLNPLLYPFEGMRAALLGQSEYINFWICLTVTALFTALFAIGALKIFKKRLDCV